jgi:hypothetical protein
MFRGYAVLVMIQAHVSNATISETLQKTTRFHYLDLWNGTIGPAFIFIAGFALGLALERKWNDFLQFHKPLWLHIRRLLFVLALGYWLHLPVWSLRQMLHWPDHTYLQSDVLHLIAVSLLLVILFALLLRNKTGMMWWTALLAVVIVFTTVFVYQLNPRLYFPAAIAAYFDRVSLFPLFPWAAYSFSGTALCLFYLRIRNTPAVGKYFLILAIGGVLMTALAFALFYAPWQYHTYTDVARESPRSFMLRLGVVLFVFSLFWFYEQKWRPSASVLNKVGQQSLMVYALHLMIVYGSPMFPTNISKAIGRSLTFLPSFGISLGLIAVMVILGLGWHELKARHKLISRVAFYGFWGFFLFRFLAQK